MRDRNICLECKKPVTTDDRRVLRHRSCYDKMIRGQIERSFCACINPDVDSLGQCDECGKPVYKAVAETPQMREAIEEREWAGPWAWHER